MDQPWVSFERANTKFNICVYLSHVQSFLESYIKFCSQLTLDMLEYFVLHRVESLLYSPPKKKIYQWISI